MSLTEMPPNCSKTPMTRKTIVATESTSDIPDSSNRAKIIILLQNAWSPLYYGDQWPRELWLKALEKSRSGKRLRIIRDLVEAAGIDIWFDNTTPVVGDTPSSVVPPDFEHMESMIRLIQPSIVVACGVLALNAIKQVYEGPILAVPHPACRNFSNLLYVKASKMIIAGMIDSKRLKWDPIEKKVKIHKI